MHTLLLAIGKLRPAYRAVGDEYLQRIRRYGPFTERELRGAGRASTSSLQRREEAARLRAALPTGGTVVALDRRGTAWSSEELARQLGRWRGHPADLVLVIGGAAGLDPDLLAEANQRWSLGPLTLPHELARVVVLEQWYRAWTMVRGEPYHRGPA